MKRFWKMLSWVGVLGLMMVGLAACSNSQSASSHNVGYDSSISKGLNAVASNKFDKALTYFDNALTQQPKDKKAQAYRDQTQAYLDTQSQLKAGQVQKALTTVTTGVEIANGAKSLKAKLGDLQQTTKTDLAEYRQLKQDVADQLKATDGSYNNGIIKQCQDINWHKKPYLKKLKPDIDKLLKQAGQQSSSSRSAASSSSSSSTATKTVSVADHKKAEQMRHNIFEADQGTYVWSELEKVPDTVVLQAESQSEAGGGDVGTTGNIIAKQYPNIKSYTGASSDNASSPGAKDYLNADEAKQELSALDFYNKNQAHIEITGQKELDDAWEFTWHFKDGNMGGTFTIENKGDVSAQSFNGTQIETKTWR
ncbi:hypothetical protein [Lactiplantibacillus plantarum]|uniref:hypothetical protein n=1 Tax=Lactiplantibacillus plantarum TaxID=1590 RepID=UPI001C1FDE61|nr:hypothetical protein [Lactiplantibacillus plantarum]MBU7470381.1 hypothetical protein [Lactiplantibacillus plantarum]